MGLLFLLGIFFLVGLLFGWLRWGTHFAVIATLILWVYGYLAQGGDLYGDGEVSAGYWAVLAGISAVGALSGWSHGKVHPSLIAGSARVTWLNRRFGR